MTFKKILLISIIITILTVYFSKNINNFDLQSYRIIGELSLKGINIYPAQAKFFHPYLPFFLYIEALAILLKPIVPSYIFIRLVNLIFYFATVYLIYLISKKNLKTVFFYALNPVLILVTLVHGQFDIIPLFFILLTLYLIKRKKEALGLLSFSMAILIKTWPVFLVIIFLKKIKNKKLLLLLPLLPLIFIIFYIFVFKSSFVSIFSTILGYRSMFNFWGVGKVVSLIFFPSLPQPPIYIQKMFLYLFLLIFFIYSFYLSYKKTLLSIVDLLMFFYVFSPGFSPQYFAWIMPFLALAKPKNWPIFVGFIVFFLAVNYSEWFFKSNFLINLGNLLNWLTWLASIFFYIYWKKNRFRSV